MRRISEKFQLGDMLPDTSPVYLKTLKAIKVKESLKNCNSQEEPKEICQLNAIRNPGWDLGTPLLCKKSASSYGFFLSIPFGVKQILVLHSCMSSQEEKYRCDRLFHLFTVFHASSPLPCVLTLLTLDLVRPMECEQMRIMLRPSRKLQ